MAQSPINIDLKSRFIERFSYNGIAAPFDESNSSFHFKQSANLKSITFETDVENFKDSFKAVRKYKGTEDIEFTDEIIIIPTSRKVTIRFDKGYPFGVCDILYFEASSTEIKNVIIEVAKWALT